MRRGAEPQARLPPGQSHTLPAVGVSETLERLGPGSAHLKALQRRSGFLHATVWIFINGSHGNRLHKGLTP